jgi:hypothetical protein
VNLFGARWIDSFASFDMANPFDRFAIEPSGADRRAVGRVVLRAFA